MGSPWPLGEGGVIGGEHTTHEMTWLCSPALWVTGPVANAFCPCPPWWVTTQFPITSPPCAWEQHGARTLGCMGTWGLQTLEGVPQPASGALSFPRFSPLPLQGSPSPRSFPLAWFASSYRKATSAGFSVCSFCRLIICVFVSGWVGAG